MKKLGSLILILVILIAGHAWAEPSPEETLTTIASSPIPVRNPSDLVVRLQGLDPTTFTYTPRPAYDVGDVEFFNMGGMEGSEARQQEFVLAAESPTFYLWVEQGISYERSAAQQVVNEAETLVLPRLREIYGDPPALSSDSHIYIMNVMSSGPGIAGVFVDTDLFPDEVFPTSNEISSVVMVVSIDSIPDFMSTLAHELQHLVQFNLDDSEETWVVEGMAEVGSFLAVPQYFSTGFQDGYVDQATGNALNYWPAEESTILYYGGASLFLTYLAQRYGETAISQMTQVPADGVIGIDAALEQLGTGIDFNAAFADFVITNYLNDPSIADGRFAHTLLNVTTRAGSDYSFDTFPVDLSGSLINQYGTHYIELNPQAPIEINFAGKSSVEILPTTAASGEYFYWSQTSNQGDSRLTGRFDLRNLTTATLLFNTWYDMEEFWDYGYLSVSTDNGASWQVIQTPEMITENPYARAFAPGYTGISASGEAMPAPYMGVDIGNDLVISGVNAATPAAAAGLLPGDEIVTIDGERIPPGFYFQMIDQYRPGETISLGIIRNGQEIIVPLTLAESPFRTVTGVNAWMQQRVDLTPFVGNEVLIRFDYVTDQAVTLPGWAIDDVTIPELTYMDNFEQSDPMWQAEGWVRITNAVPQDYLIQLIEFGDKTTITRLLEPGQGQSGTWTLEPGRYVLAVSGIAPVTTQPAAYDLVISPEG